MNDAPLGVFDSGLGGLTVVRAIREALPREDVIYLGDTARVPYGTKGEATIVKYALGCARHLVGRGVKAIVVACNTVSAVAPDRLRVELDVPVLGVIEPGARAAVAATRTGKIGVLGDGGDDRVGRVRARGERALYPRGDVGRAAPLFVPLAEEGWTDGDVPRLAARRYLEPLARAGVDVVVLGCTHYPLLRAVIEEEARAMIGPHVAVVDSAHAAASDVRAFLESRGLAKSSGAARGRIDCLVTDLPKTFADVAGRFLGGDAESVHSIDL